MKTALMSLAVVAVAAVPGVASAATVSVENGTAVYRAAPREVNTPALVSSFPVAFTDATAPLTAGPGCVPGPPVTCANTGEVSIFLGDRADSTSVDNGFGGMTIDGGDGADRITGGSVHNVAITGGNGNDAITVNANSRGTGDGGAGNDTLLGTSAGDTLTGGPGVDLLTNRQRFGGSSLDGGDGADRLVGNGSSVLTGDAGADLLVANNDGQSLDGGVGADRITSVSGGSTIFGGNGPDLINAADGTGNPDTVDCGTGYDIVWADAGDTVAANCETRSPAPAPELPGTSQAIADAAAL